LAKSNKKSFLPWFVNSLGNKKAVRKKEKKTRRD
jgi:hypothetical protein